MSGNSKKKNGSNLKNKQTPNGTKTNQTSGIQLEILGNDQELKFNSQSASKLIEQDYIAFLEDESDPLSKIQNNQIYICYKIKLKNFKKNQRCNAKQY